MLKLLILLGTSLILAYCSQNGILVYEIESSQKSRPKKLDIPLIILIVVLSLFCGLRTIYNDSWLYSELFKTSPTLAELKAGQMGIFDNPLFYFLQSFFRHHIVNSYHVWFLAVATFTNASLIRFIRKHTEHFVFSVLLFFTIGLYIDTLAAMKQCFAIAVLTYAVDALIEKKNIRFFVFVFIAMLIHTYAIFFLILPLFCHKPWTLITYITVFGLVFVLLTFESAISGFLSVADDVGKHVSEEELFDNIGINPLRLLVFSIPPILSFIFQENLDDIYDRKKNIFINMSILSFFVMFLGIFTAANLFGRCAGYFEIGTIIIFPIILENIFDKKSLRFIIILASICYIGFFLYDNYDFDIQYKAIGIIEFFKRVWQAIN